MNGGTDLRQLVAAAALANARAFGGQDYEGYHAFMALAPAYQMSRELPEPRRALPVLKVLYRNTSHIQRDRRPDARDPAPGRRLGIARDRSAAEALREATPARTWKERRGPSPRWRGARSTGRTTTCKPSCRSPQRTPGRPGLARLGPARPDGQGARPHATPPVGPVLRGRGSERPQVQKRRDPDRPAPAPRRVPPPEPNPTEHQPDDGWVERLGQTIYASDREQAADAVASALAEGFPSEAVGEAISLAANQLVLHDPGRRQEDTPAKPKGASTAPRWGSTPPTPPTPGGTSPGSATAATRSPA